MLADTGLNIEAMVLVRSVVEYGLTIAWILKKPDAHVIRFALNGIDDRLVYGALVFEVKKQRVLADRAALEAERANLAAECKSLRCQTSSNVPKRPATWTSTAST